ARRRSGPAPSASGRRRGSRRAAAAWPSPRSSSLSMAASEAPSARRAAVGQALRRGLVTPAHPLALTAERRLDERRQRALTRYYRDAGAGGGAVGVHTTQVAIRQPGGSLLPP